MTGIAATKGNCRTTVQGERVAFMVGAATVVLARRHDHLHDVATASRA